MSSRSKSSLGALKDYLFYCRDMQQCLARKKAHWVLIGDSRIRYLYSNFQFNSTLGVFRPADNGNYWINKTTSKDQYFYVDYIVANYLNDQTLSVS